MTPPRDSCPSLTNNLRLETKQIDQVRGDSHSTSPSSKSAQRDTGLQGVGRVRSGSHFCIFYETENDLLEILVPYFKTGLIANEYCLWVVAPYEFHSTAEAEEALAQALPELSRYMAEKRMEIVSYQDAFGTNGTLRTSEAIEPFREKLDAAEKRGLLRLRGSGSSAWVREQLGAANFIEYEHEIDALLGNQQLIVACTFPLRLAGAREILDAAQTHQFVVTVRQGIWERVEIGDIKAARRETRQASPKLGKLSFRQREVLQRIAEGQNTKQIAALLGLSIKTIEAHRLRLMHKLEIHDVPGLVRFAIRTGLVSAEA